VVFAALTDEVGAQCVTGLGKDQAGIAGAQAELSGKSSFQWFSF
jgi:hypothetical protein